MHPKDSGKCLLCHFRQKGEEMAGINILGLSLLSVDTVMTLILRALYDDPTCALWSDIVCVTAYNG